MEEKQSSLLQWRRDQASTNNKNTMEATPETDLVPSESSSDSSTPETVVPNTTTVTTVNDISSVPNTCTGKPCIGLDKSATGNARMKMGENRNMHESGATFKSLNFFLLLLLSFIFLF